MVPMRDGVKLHTVYFVPKDKPGPFPILMERTCYGAGSPNFAPRGVTQKMADAGYIMAFQDVRGRGPSEGEWENIRPTLPKGSKGCDESTDTFDTVEYLINNVPKNSKRVGLRGISYPGFYAGAGAIRNHPALNAVSPQAPCNDWFYGDDVNHRGAFFVQESFDFSLGFDVPRGGTYPNVDRKGKSAYDFYLQAGAHSNYDAKFLQGKIPYWNELLQHDTYDQYWKDRALWRSFTDVKCAVLNVGGLFDKEDMYGPRKLFLANEKQNPGTPNFLVMGPWSHGQWASGTAGGLAGLTYGQMTSQYYEDKIEFQFFERYLRGNMSVPAPAKATLFDTGAYTWNTFAAWPPAMKSSSLYFDEKGRLDWTVSPSSASFKYTNDPASPTPYVAGWKTLPYAPGDWLAQDQKFLNDRKDAVVFWMDPLKSDVKLAGPITADIWMTTTGTDADLVVQVLDQYPNEATPMGSYQLMVRGEIMRAKFRNSFEKPEPIVPGRPTRVQFELNDVLHTFKKGHRIGVRVMSNWFPIADRNPNTFVSRAAQKDSDFHKADIQILTGKGHPSRVVVGVLK